MFLQQKHLLSPNATPPYPHMPHMPQTRTTCLTRTCKRHHSLTSLLKPQQPFVRTLLETAKPHKLLALLTPCYIHPSMKPPHMKGSSSVRDVSWAQRRVCVSGFRVCHGELTVSTGMKAARGATDGTNHCTAVCTPSVPTLCVRRLLHRQTRQASLWAAVCAAVGRLARAFSCRLSHL